MTGHPHAGGEITGKVFTAQLPSGPSPRGWGNLDGERGQKTHVRAIPTRVGKSRRLTSGRWQQPGHPHAGGEIGGCHYCELACVGPSPRGWGNRFGCRIH